MKIVFTSFLLIILQLSSAHYENIDTVIVQDDTLLTFTRYDENDNTINIDRYKNWNRHGKQKEFYRSGQVKSSLNYKEGCPLDTLKEFFECGLLKYISTFINCKLEGIAITYSENGDTLSIGEYINGKHVGIHKSWFENGQQRRVSHFDNYGNRHGLSETWRKDGTRRDSIMYHNGDMVELREYFSDGTVRHFLVDEDGLLETAVFYDPQGNVTGKVVNGNGTVISYSEDATIKRREVYEDGVRVFLERLEPDEMPVAE